MNIKGGPFFKAPGTHIAQARKGATSPRRSWPPRGTSPSAGVRRGYEGAVAAGGVFATHAGQALQLPVEDLLRHSSAIKARAVIQMIEMAPAQTARALTVSRNKGRAITEIEAQRIERLKKLPPSRLAEVVEFLSRREERAAAAQRLTQGLARLDAPKLAELSEDEVEAEIQAARQERRGRQDA